jgi:glycosyltransferase involved in cell wall biosynthesis
MMMDAGHEVYLYAAAGSTAPCTELICCITNRLQREMIGVEGPADILKAEFNPELPYWRWFNEVAIDRIRERRRDRDFLCLIAGTAQKPIADAFPQMVAVEFGVGYSGTFAPNRVFESNAWYHAIHGAQDAANVHRTRGHFYDEIIPNYFDLADFPEPSASEDYFLYVGRLTELKGLSIAQDVCERLGRRLIVAGAGDAFSGYGEYVGLVSPTERGSLMVKAKAVFTPSLYLEPFCGVHIEAMLCGTPVITTPFGVFNETIVEGMNGFRCHTLKEFMVAAQKCYAADSHTVPKLDRGWIRQWAQARYSLEAVGPQYDAYFKRLETLYGEGFYESV